MKRLLKWLWIALVIVVIYGLPMVIIAPVFYIAVEWYDLWGFSGHWLMTIIVMIWLIVPLLLWVFHLQGDLVPFFKRVWNA